MEISCLFSIRYVHGTSVTLQGVLGTRAVLIRVASVVIAQFAFTYLPASPMISGSRPVSLCDGLAAVAVGVILLAVVEVEKRIAALLGAGRAPAQA